jgi:lycopene beta-cyclase
MPSTISCDVAIVGGGLAGGLIALALKKRKPQLDIRLIEGSTRIGGNHLWSFFGSDIAPADRWLAAPLISYGWTGYDVAFPAHARTLKAPYYSIESERFDRLVRAALPKKALMMRRKAIDVTPTAVALSGGDLIQAEGVIDCRGTGDLSKLDLGWQKFLGRELELAEPHDLERPMVMDARLEQLDGYRFAYCLPFAATRLFVEDTYYSDTPEMKAREIGRRIDAYVADRGWQVDRVTREESGSLPVAMGGDFEAYWESGGRGVAKGGMRAGLFHPMTGYSLPDAVRLASLIANARSLNGAALHTLTYNAARNAWRSRRFYRMLAAMLFRAADPHERYLVLERFYRLDAGLIARFYAGQSTLFDRLRVLSGKPPVPIGRAMRAMRRNIA